MKEQLMSELNACAEEMKSLRTKMDEEQDLFKIISIIDDIMAVHEKADKLTNKLTVLIISDYEKKVSDLTNQLKREILLRES